MGKSFSEDNNDRDVRVIITIITALGTIKFNIITSIVRTKEIGREREGREPKS